MTKKPANKLSKDAQIKRLVKQRNLLYEFLTEELFAASRLSEIEAIEIAVDGKVYIAAPKNVSWGWSPIAALCNEKVCDKKWDRMEKIVGNLYAMEGYNPATGDEDEGASEELRKLYKSHLEPWL